MVLFLYSSLLILPDVTDWDEKSRTSQIGRKGESMNKQKVWKGIGVILVAAVLWGLPAGQKESVSAETPTAPVFSRESGCYGDAFDLTLSAKEGSTIYYTTDGSIPLSKEDTAAVATPTPLPTPTAKPVVFNLSPDNTEYVYDVEIEKKKDGTSLAFGWQYRSMCFAVPEGVTDWTGYGKLVVDFSVDKAHNGEYVGLQACPIYSWADDSYSGGADRCFEARTQADLGAEHEIWEINLAGKDVSEVGWLMFGATTTNSERSDPFDTVTIHSVKLVKESIGGEPDPKADTQVYQNPIRVKDRSGEPNVLTSKNNVKLTYNTGYTGAYAPKDDEVNKATVIRAMAVDAEGNRSPVVTKTYFVGNDLAATYKNATVMSVVTDPDNLLNTEQGIMRVENYENKGREWERQAFVEYFDEDGTIPFSTEMGIRIHGGYSRHYGQKSFNLYFREEYGGLKNLKGYELIPGAMNYDKTKKTLKYKNFMLRNGGNDTEYTKIQDVWIQSMLQDRAYTTQAARPCVLFLNGEYWGLYNLTEKYSDNYLEEEFGVDKANVVIIKEGEVDEGEDTDIALYEELMAMADLDMTKEENYKKFCDMVDLQSFLDYYATEIYIGNCDWDSEKNICLWRTREKESGKYGDAKWRWMLYDTEYSMQLYDDTSADHLLRIMAYNDPLFGAVIENEDFKNRFIGTLMDLANVNFREETAVASLNRYVALYKPLLEEYYIRFGLDDSLFDKNITRMKNFLKKRRLNIQTDLKMYMEAGASTVLTLKSNERVTLGVNTSRVELTGKDWTGTYFKQCGLTLTAPDLAGRRFAGWQLQNAATTDALTEKTIHVTLGTRPVVTARYEPVAADVQPTIQPSAPPVSPTPTPGEENVTKKPGKVKGLSLASKKKKTLTIRWKKVKGASGYQILLSADRKGKKQKKVYSVKKTSKTVRKLKAKKVYYVKVRAYTTDASGKKKYGSYSTSKKKKIK